MRGDEDEEGDAGSGSSSLSSSDTKLEKKTFPLFSPSSDEDQLIVWSLAQNI